MNTATHRLPLKKQFLFSVLSIIGISAICYLFSDLIGYRSVAFVLLITVSFLAMLFDIYPVLLSAGLSAVVWNFFFIPPKFTFAIRGGEDLLMFSMYFIVASVHAVLTFKIRQMEKAATKRIEEENTLKLYSAVFNSLSHELRTPISTIIAATDNLQAMADKLSEVNKHELITEISRSGIRLNRQVSNLLNMSRLESGFLQPKYDWFDVNELIHDVVKQMKDELQGKPVHISIKERLPLFRLDYGLLFQIVHNLIHNAVMHIPKYAVITARAFCKDNKLVIVIEDTGHGFPSEDLPKFFEKFYRSKDAPSGGIGLGLAIVKGFTEAMKGTVILGNMPDGGAMVTIEIPSELSYEPLAK